jgi:hypothetical protein
MSTHWPWTVIGELAGGGMVTSWSFDYWGREVRLVRDNGLRPTRLGPASQSEWRVEVVVEPVGWLGTYQRSPEMGYWYSGTHDLHLVGNPF